MKNTLQKQIEKLFESGEIQTIKFSKTGRITVKFKKEPNLVTYPKNENNLKYIMEDAKLRESLESVVMKQKVKITVAEVEKLNAIAEEIKPSLFDSFYDSVSKFIGGGKTFAPNELKSFR